MKALFFAIFLVAACVTAASLAYDESIDANAHRIINTGVYDFFRQMAKLSH